MLKSLLHRWAAIIAMHLVKTLRVNDRLEGEDDELVVVISYNKLQESPVARRYRQMEAGML